MAFQLFVLAFVLAAVVAGDESDGPQVLDTFTIDLPKPPSYPDTPEKKTTYFAGISSTVWILLTIKLIFIVIALASLFIWCRQRNKNKKYTVHV
ncbi:unnamed protein product [Nezara viridula]|uniref:Neuropeptide n=1 Tax=Nezara viridula TaxID=85310 RepID=A0A9P0H3M5_NEZVI|nr:unnamed protein product [Nezara viridula]